MRMTKSLLIAYLTVITLCGSLLHANENSGEEEVLKNAIEKHYGKGGALSTTQRKKLESIIKMDEDDEKYSKLGEFLERLESTPATPAPPSLDYDPRLFFIGLGFSTTSRMLFDSPFRAYRPGDTAGNPTGKRYMELKDKSDVKIGSVLTFRLRYNARIMNGERLLFDPPSRRIVNALRSESRYWPAPVDISKAYNAMKSADPVLKAMEDAGADQEAILEKMNAVLGGALMSGGQVKAGGYFMDFFELSLDVFLDEDTGKNALSQGLRSQAGLALQGSISPVGWDLLFTTLTDDGTSFEPTLGWSMGPSAYGWVATNYEFGVMQYFVGGGFEQNFVIPGFTSYVREIVQTDKSGKATTAVAKGYRAAEVRLGVYLGTFNTPDLDEHLVATSPTTTERSSYIRVSKYGVPDYDDALGWLVTTDVYLPFGSAAIIYVRANILISREVTTWESQVGVTISLSDLAAVFK